MRNLVKEAQTYWRKTDIQEVARLKNRIKFFNELYLQYIHKNPKCAGYIKDIISGSIKEMEQLNDKLYPKNNSYKRLIKWH